jgi:hypothetical protein
MTETDTPPARGLKTRGPKTRGPKTRALGLLGMWLCAVALFPLLAVWMGFFHPRRPLHLPSVGSPKFWPMVGLDVLVASLMTLSAWSDRNKPSRRRATSPATPEDRLRRGLAGAGILAFLILRVLAVNWPGVLGGAAALALLFVLLLRCAALAQPPPAPPPMGEEAGNVVPASLPWSPPAPLGVRPPPNRYRAKVSAREVVYHRPPAARIGAWVGVLFFVTMFAGSLGFALLGLGLVFVPGMHMRENPAMALMMGGGAVFFVCAALSILAMTGPRVLRVSPSDRTYTYRASAPLRWPVMTGIVGAANRDELGLPWRISEYRGDVGDMAGIQMRETMYKSSTAYSLFLRWRDPARPSLRVGYAVTEDKARALQAQAADDLGVLRLPDETDGKLTE